MAKLPETFVKAPPADPGAPSRPRRARKSSIIAEAPRDLRELLLRLDDAEYQALEDARDALRRAGEDLTLEQMIHRVLTDWACARTAPATVPTSAAAATAAVHRDENLVERLRAFAAAPLRTWRELGATLRRMSGLPARGH